MPDESTMTFTAFSGPRRLASGALIDVALAVKAKAAGGTSEPILVFDDASGAVVDLDLRGTKADIAARLARPENAGAATGDPSEWSSDRPVRARGRPKLGVVAREVTLLPRQWEWLALQPGGASQALRRLVDDARRANGDEARMKTAREAAYRFLSALAGDLPGFEEVIRALFAGDVESFADRMIAWPSDIRHHALKLATPA